jgi:serine/threonine-protein kinase
VAVKLLWGLERAEDRARFASLVHRLTSLHHRHLVPVVDHGEQDGVPYLVQGFVNGSDLAGHMRAGAVDLPAALTLLRELAAVIDHCHRCGFIHGALKPSQVILDGDVQPHLTDLGLAPLSWPWPSGRGGVSRAGSAAYTAPELAVGGRPHPAADRYALAAIGYELLTGRLPFEGDPHQVLRAQLAAPPAPPSAFEGALSPAMDEVVLRGLARDPLARWPSCSEMVEALSAASGGLDTVEVHVPPAAPDAPPSEPATAEARSGSMRRALVAMGLAVASLGAALGSASNLLIVPPTVAITLSSSTAELGGTIVITATNLPPGQPVSVQMRSDHELIGLIRADAHGTARARVTLPQDATFGDHVITLCWDDACHGGTHLTILTPVPAPPTRFSRVP